MKNKLLFSFLCLFTSHYANAQTTSITIDPDGRMITTVSSKIMGRRGVSSSDFTFLGSPFLGGSIWHLGTITLDNQMVIPAVLSYNLSYGTLYTVDSVAQTNISINPVAFTFEGAEFIRFKTHFLGFSNDEYGNLIYDGNTKLVVKLKKIVSKPNNFRHVNIEEDGVYMDSNEYYLQKQDGEFEHINLNNRSILAKLMDKKNEVSEFLRSTKLNLKEEKNLITVLKFYDGLSKN